MILWSAEADFTIQIYYRIFFTKFSTLSYSHYACGSDEDISQFVGLVPANGCLITQKIHIGCTDEIIRIRECDQRDQNTVQCQKCRTCWCVISRGCAFLRLLDLGCIFRASKAGTWKDSPQDKVGRNRIPQQGGWGHQSRGCLRPDFHARQINLLQPALSSSNSTSSSWLRSQWKSNRNDNFSYLRFLIFFIKIHTDLRNLPT